MLPAMLRGSLFAAVCLVVVLIWELFTFELPREPIPQDWKDLVQLHTVLAFSVAASALIGGTAGFFAVPRDRVLSKTRVAVLGAVFAFPAFAILGLAIEVAGVVWSLAALVVVFAAVSFAGGYFLSRNAA